MLYYLRNTKRMLTQLIMTSVVEKIMKKNIINLNLRKVLSKDPVGQEMLLVINLMNLMT
jgi:hypothetical protein